MTQASGAVVEAVTQASGAVSETVNQVVANGGSDIFTQLADLVHNFMDWIAVLPVPGFVSDMVIGQ